MSKNIKSAKKTPAPVSQTEQPKLKKIKTGLKGGMAADPCNNGNAS